jgi:hypothetical protein
VQRVRVSFAKGPEIRFIGHLDVVRLWERAARRARLPLAYTLGFTPHPRLAFAAPLALGATGERELLDVYFTQEVPLDELRARLGAQMPPGCSIVDLQHVPLDEPALTARIRWAEYRVHASESLPAGAPAGDDQVPVGDNPTTGAQGSRWSPGATSDTTLLPTAEELAALAITNSPWRPPAQRLAPLLPQPTLPSPTDVQRRVDRFLAAEHVPWYREREGKRSERDVRAAVLDLWILPVTSPSEGPTDDSGPGTEDLRPGTQDWRLRTSDFGLTLAMLLRAGSSGAGRPEEVAAVLGLRARRIHRLRLGLEGEPPVPSSR